MGQSLKKAVANVAEYTVERDMENETWERATAINGLLATGEQIDRARKSIDRAIETQTDQGNFAYGPADKLSFSDNRAAEWTDYDFEAIHSTWSAASLAWPALKFYQRTGEERYLNAVSKQYQYFETVDRTADGGISRRDGPVELFTEILYFVCPFFVQYGKLADEEAPIEDAVRQVRVHAKHLQDSQTGLYRHIWRENPDSYPASSYWGRAVGWAVAGLLDTFLTLPDNHAGRSVVRDSLERCLDGLLQYQDATGFCRQRIDDPKSPLETSGTAMFSYTLQRSIDEGIFDKQEYEAAAQRGIDACLGVVTDEGAVRRCSRPPASSFAPLGVTSYGQGWFLLAASRFVS